MVDHKVTHGISLICDLCKKCFDSELSLINHSLNHSFDLYVCNTCDEKFYGQAELSNHLRHHAKQKNFQEKNSFCHSRNAATYTKCGKELINKNHIKQQATHSAEFSRLCSSSVKSSISIEGFNNKIVVNKPDVIKSKEIKQTVKLSNLKQNFACVICDDCFADEQDLLNHSLNQHSGQPVYQCVVCSEKFSSRQELVNHGQTHLHEETDMCSLYDEKLQECVVLDDVDESSPKRRCVKVRYLFQPIDESCNQNTRQHLGSDQEIISDSHNNILSEVNCMSKLPYSDSSDTHISIIQDRELSTKLSANILSEILKKANSGIYKNSENISVNNKYDHGAQIKILEKSIYGEKYKTKNKILVKLNNEQEHSSKSEITLSPSDDLNSNIKNLNLFHTDPLESYCIAYNQETNEFEVFIEAAHGSKANISSQNLDLYKKNPETKEVSSNSNQSKSVEIDDIIQNVNDRGKNENERLCIQNKISDVKTVDACLENKRTAKSGKIYNAETYLDVEDCNDISGLVAVVYNDDSNSVVTTYEVCELEVVDTDDKNSPLQRSETCSLESGIVQKNSVNRDVENAVASIEMELCNDKSFLESSDGHRVENTDSLNLDHLDQTVNPMQGDIVLTDVTQIKEQKFLSDLFGGKFVSENNVIKHISPCVKKKTDICHICKKAYSSKLALLRHIYIHSGEKPFSCNFCDKKYSRKYDLNDHLLNHTGQKPYACPVCSKGFIRKSHVDKHMLIHSDEKPFLCDVCGKNFSRKDYLIGHRLNHVDNNPFMCPTCDQTFSEREDLDAHRAIHAVQVSYVCAICKKRFTQKRHLERHLSIHTGEKPFGCDICKKQFARKDALYTHKKCHRKEKSLECSECGKNFSQKLSFLRHIRIHASEKALHSKNKKKLSMQARSHNNNVLSDNISS